jgi:hypothetical protein
MMSAHAAVVRMIANHNDLEKAAKEPRPYSPEEKLVIDALLSSQKAVADSTRSPLPDPFMEATKRAGDVANKITGAAGSAAGGLALGLVAIAAVGAYVSMQEK